MYQQYQPINKVAHDASMYDILANYYKYLDPQKHIYYYQMHLMCMQQLIQHQGYPFNDFMRSPMMNNETAKVRVLHASPDAPRVDIYINGKKTFRNMMYYQISPYMDLQPGSYEIEVFPAGETKNPVLTKTVEVNSGKNYTIAAANVLEDLQLVAIEDETDVPVGKAMARIWHLAPNAPAVDIAVADGDVLFENVAFGEVADYIELAPGMVTLEVREAGTENIVLTLRNTNLKANKAYTIAAIGLLEGQPRFEALVLNP